MSSSSSTSPASSGSSSPSHSDHGQEGSLAAAHHDRHAPSSLQEYHQAPAPAPAAAPSLDHPLGSATAVHHQASSPTPHQDSAELRQSAGLAPSNTSNALVDPDETEDEADSSTVPAPFGPRFSNRQLPAEVRADVNRMMAMEDQIAGLEADVEELRQELDNERDAREIERARLEQENEAAQMELANEKVVREAEKARLEKERDEARKALADREYCLLFCRPFSPGCF